MKKLLKRLIPPLLWDKFQYIRSYKHFLKYKNLVAKNIELKNLHKGKRCFILGSGPSIKNENLKPLKNEIVFALNNFYVHEDFQEIMSGDVDKYYMTAPIHPPQTENEWKAWFEDMEKYIPKETNIIFGLNLYKGNIKYILEKHEIFKQNNLSWYYAGINTDENYSLNPKDIDLTNMILVANTVSIYALITAIYMGFDEIYLLGMDHNYICLKEADWRFFQTAIHQVDEVKRSMNGSSHTKSFFKQTFTIFEHYEILSKNKSKIYNMSDTSLLDMFEYKKLKELIK